MTTIVPAETYLPCPDLGIITTYFNPVGYQTLRCNYERFAAPIRQAGLNLITVECAFGSGSFELDSSSQVIQVRSRDVMWLKERLINLAIARLPSHVTKVAWLDADILFTNPAWAQETAARLDDYPVVQPFDCVARQQHSRDMEAKARRRSFACQHQRRPESAHLSSAAHGQPGIAWAARRALLEKHTLYDAAIVGGGDELFAHATGGGFNSRCVKAITGARLQSRPKIVGKVVNRLLRLPWPSQLVAWYLACLPAPPVSAPEEWFLAHYLAWAQPFYADVRGQVGCVPGVALHLWHGHPVNRQYSHRNALLKQHSFNPVADLQLNEHGVWEWAGSKPGLAQQIRDYFYARQEDNEAIGLVTKFSNR